VSAACPRYGFEVRARIEPGLDGASRSALWDSLGRILDARGLSATRSGEDVWTLVVTRDGGQAIDADRLALVQWLEGRTEVVEHVAGPLVDLSA
jgi:YggL 50S ribosome-binding protein